MEHTLARIHIQTDTDRWTDGHRQTDRQRQVGYHVSLILFYCTKKPRMKTEDSIMHSLKLGSERH